MSVLSLLTGKKTISTLYAALVSNQLQWLNLMPTLRRDDFLRSVARLQAAGWLRAVGPDVEITVTGARQQVASAHHHPLPSHYDFRLNVTEFADRLFLAVQVVSEASFDNNTYVPVSSEWSVQRAIKRWYRQYGHDYQAVVTELTDAFAAMAPAQADFLAARLVGHDFAGSAELTSDEWGWQLLDAVGTLIHVLHRQPDHFPLLTALWGGPINPLPALGQKSLELVNQGLDIPTVARRLRRKDSTINEHIQAAAIWGLPVNTHVLLPEALAQQLVSAWAGGAHDYRQLQALVPDASFLQVRLAQVACVRREQGHGD
ncbi:helix-turn-helix domain-containing protein [Lacticaseibacillus thailandensis]|uniref:helix-turn-helix domain-containing protein n=1 Tax=Lacticaseibacillus thailandensis TaxID=381741 RepID=UPI000AF8D3DD|nr:helix-turn-helix domain-containing protein [Lacticaseibacillus thailandensis]